jgi:hypothetical protein
MLPPPLIPGTEGLGKRPYWSPRGNIPIVSHRLPNLHFDELTTYIFNKPENRALGGEESADGTSKIDRAI